MSRKYKIKINNNGVKYFYSSSSPDDLYDALEILYINAFNKGNDYLKLVDFSNNDIIDENYINLIKWLKMQIDNVLSIALEKDKFWDNLNVYENFKLFNISFVKGSKYSYYIKFPKYFSSHFKGHVIIEYYGRVYEKMQKLFKEINDSEFCKYLNKYQISQIVFLLETLGKYSLEEYNYVKLFNIVKQSEDNVAKSKENVNETEEKIIIFENE